MFRLNRNVLLFSLSVSPSLNINLEQLWGETVDVLQDPPNVAWFFKLLNILEQNKIMWWYTLTQMRKYISVLIIMHIVSN